MIEIQKSMLRDIGKVLMCKRVLKSQTSNIGEIPFYKISTFGGKADTFITNELYEDYKQKYSHPKKSDVLISAAGTVGKTVIYDGSKAYFQDSNIVWIDNDESKVLNSYLYYFYQTEPWLTTKGSTINRIYNDNLRNIEITYPNLLEQQKIAKVLSDIDKKIDFNNKINAELEAMAKLIYDYWFVQFDFTDANGNPYKSSGGKMVYNEKLNREVPEGWQVEKLGDVLKTSLGGTPSTKASEYWENAKISWLNSGEVVNFPVLDSEQCITQKGIDNSAAELLPIGSVIISIVRHIRVSILAVDAAFNQSVVGLYETDSLKSSFLYLYLSREIPRLMSLRTGAQQPHINKKFVDESLIVIPPKEIIDKYYAAVNSIFEKINITAMENKKLVELRDWLLPMLMNGQVKVV